MDCTAAPRAPVFSHSDAAAPVPASSDRPRPATRAWVAVVAGLLALVLFLRKPDTLLNPQFWAEDGAFYFQQAYDQGFLQTLLTPFSGYLHTLPRLGAGLALLFPLRAAPLVYALVAFCVQMLPVLYLLGERMGRWIPDRRLRVIAALLYVAVPNSYETYVSLVSSQWNLALVGLLLLVIDPPVSAAGKAGDLLFLLLFVGTGPFSIFLLPCALLNLLRERRGARRAWFVTQSAVVAAGAALQASFIFTSGRTPPPEGSWPQLSQLLSILSVHVVFNSLLGINGTIEHSRFLTLPVCVAGLALAATLAFFALRRRRRPLTWLLGLAGAVVCSWLLLPTNPIAEWRWPDYGPRYFTFASLFVLYAILQLCAEQGRVRLLGGLLALPVLTLALPGDFAHRRRADTCYPDQVAVFESLPVGKSFFVPIQPQGWGIVLRRKSGEPAPPPLGGLQRVDGKPAHHWDENSFTILTAGRKEPYLHLSGWAADTPANKPAGGVWLEIDGNLFPALYGAESPMAGLLLRDRRYDVSGFSRDIPTSELGVGRHRLSMIVLTADRKGFYRLPWRFFTIAGRDASAEPR